MEFATVPYVLGRGSTAMVYDGVSSVTLMKIQILGHLIGHLMVKVYLLANGNDTISFYTVSIPYDITSTVTYKHAIETTGLETKDIQFVLLMPIIKLMEAVDINFTPWDW